MTLRQLIDSLIDLEEAAKTIGDPPVRVASLGYAEWREEDRLVDLETVSLRFNNGDIILGVDK